MPRGWSSISGQPQWPAAGCGEASRQADGLGAPAHRRQPATLTVKRRLSVMFSKAWQVLKFTANGYIEDGCLSRGAAIAYYTVFSLAPVLIIVIAIAGFVFGADAARGALLAEISSLMGRQGGEAVQTMIASASNQNRSGWAGAVGLITLVVTASGVFSELQAALNAIWRSKPRAGTISRLVRARLASLGLVMTLGFLLLVSLVVSTALSALGPWLDGLFPGAKILMQAVSFLVSLGLVALLFGLIYKMLPDASLAWRDVTAGAIATAILFEVGKFFISLYLGSSSVTSSFGAAGALALLLLWIYYSSQIFLIGAEFTRAWADIVHGRGPDTVSTQAEDVVRPRPDAEAKPAASGTASHGEKLRTPKSDLEENPTPPR
jgi:membrane protein